MIVKYTARYVVPLNSIGVEEEGWEIPGPDETEGVWDDLDEAKEYVRHRRHLRLVKLTDMSSILEELIRRRELVRKELEELRQPLRGLEDADILDINTKLITALTLADLLSDFIILIQTKQRIS